MRPGGSSTHGSTGGSAGRWCRGFAATLRDLKQQYLWREQVRSDLTRVAPLLRRLHLALADRFVERGWIAARDDYFLLTLDEIRPAIDDPRAGPGLRTQVTQRQSEVAAMRAASMPYLIAKRIDRRRRRDDLRRETS